MTKNNLLHHQKSFFTICMLLMLAFSFTNAQAQVTDPTQARKLFIDHFMKYILWPKEDFQKDFKIKVYKDERIFSALKDTYDQKDFRGRKILVERASSVDELQGSDVVYVPREESDAAPVIVETVNNSAALVITNLNTEGKKGSTINFREKNGGLSFELDLDVAEKAGLKVYNQLRQVATLL